jgi:predicted ferric reductase
MARHVTAPVSPRSAAPRSAAPRPVPLPRTWSFGVVEVVAVLAANTVVILAMWLRHGGLEGLGTLGAQATAVGQLTGLYGTYLALIQLVLMSRSPWLDQAFGMDGLARAHRWLGFATVWLLLAHVVFITTGYALGDGSNVVAEFWTLITTYPYVLMALASAGLFAMVAVSSIRAARRRLSYETWYGLHLYAYLAIALGFLHQLFVGADFIHDPIAVGYWVALYVVTVVLVLVFRIGQPMWLSARHRLRVSHIATEAPGVISIYVTGRDLDRLAVRSGQYFVWRFLTRDGWWRGHPFSISSAPNGSWLRITIKELGDWSKALQRVSIGTRVFIEGPYGVLTGARRTRPKVLLVAGGIGITPLRALLEALPAKRGDLTLLYRVRSHDDVVFREELETLARERGATVQYLVGRRDATGDQLDAASLGRFVPDITERDVYLCGPVPMMQRVEASLRALGLPSDRIHAERFAY